MKKLIYVAGKYTGETNIEIKSNIKKAEATGINLILKKWAVITPHKNYAGYEKLDDFRFGEYRITYQDIIDNCLALLDRCDAIFMLENWQESEGAKIEHDYAKEKGIPIYYQVNGYPDVDDIIKE